MNIPRLKRMIEVLEEVEAKHAGHFDLNVLAEATADDANESVIFDEDAFLYILKHACGSAACAVGWYAVLVPESGITLGSYSIWDDTEEYFGIDTETWDKLFLPEFYEADPVPPRHVINRIREMIGEGV